jgi:hypothetical protein
MPHAHQDPSAPIRLLSSSLVPSVSPSGRVLTATIPKKYSCPRPRHC